MGTQHKYQLPDHNMNQYNQLETWLPYKRVWKWSLRLLAFCFFSSRSWLSTNGRTDLLSAVLVFLPWNGFSLRLPAKSWACFFVPGGQRCSFSAASCCSQGVTAFVGTIWRTGLFCHIGKMFSLWCWSSTDLQCLTDYWSQSVGRCLKFLAIKKRKSVIWMSTATPTKGTSTNSGLYSSGLKMKITLLNANCWKSQLTFAGSSRESIPVSPVFQKVSSI